ncbi:MAG: alpha-amylase family glycosyl hydrolase [Aggregatilineales bacterium]
MARDHYRFDNTLFASSGKADIADFHAARVFAQQMNQQRDLAAFPEQAVSAGQVNAMALIHGFTQHLFRVYCEQHDPHLLRRALDRLYAQLGTKAVDEALHRFVDEFPPMSVYLRELNRETYLESATGNRTNREIALEELLMLWLSNSNPAFSPFLELFGDDNLETKTPYPRIITDLYQYFGQIAESDATQKGSFTGGQNIIDFLLVPARVSPHSLEGQLTVLMERWGGLIGAYAYRLLRSMDLIKEEQKPFFGGGPGPTLIPTFAPDIMAYEPEQFSPDREWMPNLVMIAKNTYVWLDQLSKKYGYPITRLDQIPDQELDTLARWGFTGLWFIGLWERSTASQTIKQLCGNPEAVASAYSLYDYQIAAGLGGETARENLSRRAWRRGIRLASDMVPNHVGVDGRWLIEHPDWFVSLGYSPFPNYDFNGPDLSRDARVGIYLENHYYSRTDAAVVFKRVDRWTGDERYVYHGNDGTSLPWNDTAQLNYLNPEMREAMIQTILYIARQFPIIRFDAAMTLVKKHVQRLWFPEPGGGGAIPSRAEHGMTKAQFEALMPQEFWREVVDRVAVEAPDTLLLAEAFWLMESYFVRTLGMHRVYNSAFMNILRDEENAKYRLVMKNTLEFDPEILKRYVNFMNNPDERTAVDQFGKDDKYFGICTLLATMPGLPMFGHGQIEGFAEKYGMEYRRAYFDEQPDSYLIQRHEREIFPLLRKRYLFAGVEDFLLYDFFASDGAVNEDVFAYSNSAGGERTLVVYHNRYATVSGWIRTSAAYSAKTGNGDERTLVQRSLGEGLGLRSDENQFVIFRDERAGVQYLRNAKAICEQGLYIELGAYQYHVFLDFRVVMDDAAHQYKHLASQLDGRGVPSISEALQEILVQPVREPFQALVNAAMFRRLLDARVAESDQALDEALLDEVEEKLLALLRAIVDFTQTSPPQSPSPLRSEGEAEQTIVQVEQTVRSQLEAILRLQLPKTPLLTVAAAKEKALPKAQEEKADDSALWSGLFGWLFVHALGEITDKSDSAEQSRSWIDEWLLGKVIRSTLQALGESDQAATQTLAAIKFATTHQELLAGHADERADLMLDAILKDSDAQQLLGVNRFNDILWFSKEGFEQLSYWMLLLAGLPVNSDVPGSNAALVAARTRTVDQLRQAAKASEYQVEKLRAETVKISRKALPTVAKPKRSSRKPASG